MAPDTQPVLSEAVILNINDEEAPRYIVSRTLAQTLGGRLRIEGRAGQGTMITLVFPLTPPQENTLRHL